jgi:hypothetical protein
MGWCRIFSRWNNNVLSIRVFYFLYLSITLDQYTVQPPVTSKVLEFLRIFR